MDLGFVAEQSGSDEVGLAGSVGTKLGEMRFLCRDECSFVSRCSADRTPIGNPSDSEHYDGGEQPEDHDHDQQLDESEPLVMSSWVCVHIGCIGRILSDLTQGLLKLCERPGELIEANSSAFLANNVDQLASQL